MLTILNKVKDVKTIDAETFLGLNFNTLKDLKRNTTKLENAMVKGGWSFPIFKWQDFVIDGTGRRQAVNNLIKKGYVIPEIPYVEIDAKDLKDAKQKALEVSSQYGNINRDSFLDFTQDIELDFDTFEISGMTADSFIESDEKDDETPPLPEAPRSKLGDIYELGVHRVMCGDSTQETAISALMDGEKAVMVFTDPPYGVGYVSRVDKDRRKEWGGIKNDDLKGLQLQEFIINSLKFYENVKSKYVCCNWQSVKDFFAALDMPNSLIVWDKKSIGLGANYRSQHEFILFYGKLSHRGESNVWALKRDANGEYVHPTQKPVELIVRAIVNSSNKEDIIVDPFLGSGSTIIASEKTGRMCYGMELDPKYVDVIVQRYVNFTDNESIIKNGEQITWPKSIKDK